MSYNNLPHRIFVTIREEKVFEELSIRIVISSKYFGLPCAMHCSKVFTYIINSVNVRSLIIQIRKWVQRN